MDGAAIKSAQPGVEAAGDLSQSSIVAVGDNGGAGGTGGAGNGGGIIGDGAVGGAGGEGAGGKIPLVAI